MPETTASAENSNRPASGIGEDQVGGLGPAQGVDADVPLVLEPGRARRAERNGIARRLGRGPRGQAGVLADRPVRPCGGGVALRRSCRADPDRRALGGSVTFPVSAARRIVAGQPLADAGQRRRSRRQARASEIGQDRRGHPGRRIVETHRVVGIFSRSRVAGVAALPSGDLDQEQERPGVLDRLLVGGEGRDLGGEFVELAGLLRGVDQQRGAWRRPRRRGSQPGHAEGGRAATSRVGEEDAARLRTVLRSAVGQGPLLEDR